MLDVLLLRIKYKIGEILLSMVRLDVQLNKLVLVLVIKRFIRNNKNINFLIIISRAIMEDKKMKCFYLGGCCGKYSPFK